MEDLAKTCWSMFCKTGEVNYYMLYKALKEEDNTVGTNKV